MKKRLALVAVAVVGVVGIAAWSVAQSPGDKSQTKSPLSGTASGSTTSGSSAGGKTTSGSTDGGIKASGTPASSSSSSLPRLTPSSSSSSGRSSSSLFPSSTTSSGARSPLTTSRGLPDLDSSLSPSRGSSSRGDLSPGSSVPSGNTIRIDHALVTSLDPIKLPARAPGAIRSIAVKKGVEVKADDILGQLDDRDAQTKKKIAELERDAAKIQAESEAQITAAKEGAKVTEENYKANEKLRNDRPGSLSDFDFRRSWFEWRRALAQIAVAEVEKAVAQATQLAKEGQIEGSMNEIERLKIVAPIDGFVHEVYKHVGEWCQPGDPVMEIIRMDRVEIEGFVFAADASPAKVLGKPVDVIVQLAGGETHKASGTITFASPVLEGSGRIRQFRVSTEVENKKNGDHWIIQVGTEAEMVIHLEPPAPKPAVSPKTGLPGGSKASVPGTKIETYKPAVPDLGGKGGTTKAGAKTETKSGEKTDAKPESKSGDKSKSPDTSADGKKSAKENKTDAGNSDRQTEKSDATKASAAKPADDSGKDDKSTDKRGKTPSKGTKIKI